MVKMATNQNGDTKTATKLAWSTQNGDKSKRRQTKTVQVKTATGTLCG